MSKSPEDPTELNQLGTQFATVGDFDKARKYFAKAVAIDDSDVDFQINLANVYCALGEFRLSYQKFARRLKT